MKRYKFFLLKTDPFLGCNAFLNNQKLKEKFSDSLKTQIFISNLFQKSLFYIF